MTKQSALATSRNSIDADDLGLVIVRVRMTYWVAHLRSHGCGAKRGPC